MLSALLLMTVQIGACTFTTNIPEFEKDAELACKAELAMSIDVTGEYPGDVAVTVEYGFDYASKGARRVAGTRLRSLLGKRQCSRTRRCAFGTPGCAGTPWRCAIGSVSCAGSCSTPSTGFRRARCA